MSDIKTDIWEELRKPFPSETVGLLPKVSCYNCTQATKTAKSALDKHCSQHRMEKCNDCGAYITTGHIHLDYVGHAAVTDRLNNAVGPDNWTWRPLATDEHGLPLLDKNGNLWIELTVAGVSRIGYGDGSSSIKELIGDALRNAAMRFGVALDLWSKDELESTLDAPETKNVRPSASTKAAEPTTPPAPADKLVGPAQAAVLLRAASAASGIEDKAELAAFFKETIGKDITQVHTGEVQGVLAKFKAGDVEGAA